MRAICVTNHTARKPGAVTAPWRVQQKQQRHPKVPLGGW